MSSSSKRDRITGIHQQRGSTTSTTASSSTTKARKGGSSPRTITPTSSQEEERTGSNMSSAPARNTGNRFSTKSSNSKKPWLDRSAEYNSDDGSNSDINKGKGNLRRTKSGDEHVLHAPKLSPSGQRKGGKGNRRRITMPTNPDEDESESNHMDADLVPSQAFDDLWDESTMNGGDTTGRPRGAAEQEPPISALGMLPKKSPTPPKRRQKDERIEKTPTPQEYQQPQPKQSSSSAKEIDTTKFHKKENEIDTSKFIKKGSRAPPNTPTDDVYAVENTAAVCVDESGEDQSKRSNPIRHRRKSTNSKPTRSKSSSSSRSGTSSSRKQRPSRMINKMDASASPSTSKEEEKPKATEYKDKDEAIASLEKQLDRVTFLQKRQFDQLSSLKKMLLSSRAKEKEHVKTKEEIQQSLDSRDSKIASLEEQLEQSKYLRKQAQSAGSMMAASSSDLQFSVGDAGSKEKSLRIIELEQQIQEMERRHEKAMKTKEADMSTKLEEREAKIAQLEKRVESLESSQKESSGQAENALAIAQTKLLKKVEHAATLHEEMEEMREQLTAAHSTIEQLEEERNYSRAKMAELNDMVSSKGGLTNTEQELLERAAEISNLSSKLSVIDGKVQERDNRIFKMEEEIKGINELVQQLSDGFVGDDEERKNQQRLLIESATSPGQTSSLLLMTMMNMLDALKAKIEVLQKERDDMNAKASDRGIQLAESHIRVDKLRTELRRMRAERERARTNPNDPRRPPPPGARPRPASHTVGTGAPRPGGANMQRTQSDRPTSLVQDQNRRNPSSGNLKDQMIQSSERSTSTAPTLSTTPSQKPSRFMNFLKGNLTSEVGPDPSNDKSPGASRPLTVKI